MSAAGICHARGENAKLPPQGLIYITVANLERSLKECRSLGGQVVVPAREMGSGQFAAAEAELHQPCSGRRRTGGCDVAN